MEYRIEQMTEEHREEVIDVYNYFITNSYAAYPEEEVDYEFYDHFVRMTSGFPAYVVKDDNDTVVGFAFMSAVHLAQTFQKTAGVSYFILPDHTRKGSGRTILELFEEFAAGIGIDSLLAHVSSLNPDSVRFHEQNGFEECGRFREVGVKFGRNYDVIWMQKRLT